MSIEALELARDNAKLNNAEVAFIHANILNEKLNFSGNNKFDVIVSNPPYVRTQDQDQMKPNVLNYEPHLALFVEDNDPLKFFSAICKFAFTNLKNEGLLYFEINEFLGIQVKKLLQEHDFKNIELRKDVYNKNRMIKATK